MINRNEKKQKPKSLDDKMEEEGFERVATLYTGQDGRVTIPSDVVLGQATNSLFINPRSYDELRIVPQKGKNNQGTFVVYGKRSKRYDDVLERINEMNSLLEKSFPNKNLPEDIILHKPTYLDYSPKSLGRHDMLPELKTRLYSSI